MEATRRRTEVDGMSAEQMQQTINEAVREATESLRSEVQARRPRRTVRTKPSAFCQQQREVMDRVLPVAR